MALYSYFDYTQLTVLDKIMQMSDWKYEDYLLQQRYLLKSLALKKVRTLKAVQLHGRQEQFF
ncbi:MAG: hypothetical protein A2525_09145 [Sulfurimonas sp. RIFOXYD12_FULL_36_11]|nr:MAG: hypothetical protein A2540_01270 [Sulfurimonas sp. RIFOXYD2_FULL_37_8]OHE17774.1 MAG: hypothetical protein A2525_09145 [Sulfurimonas sp. RIFOXYD12_FULL_36_11]